MTRIDIPADKREKLCALLNANLAGGLDLALAIKQAHWNVKGPTFRELHELFDMLRTNIDVHNDDMAERVATLGGNARGTVQAVTSTTKLPAFPIDDHNGPSLTTALADRYAAHSKNVRAAIDEAAALGDAVSADLFTGITRGLDKDLWFLESHLSK